jgi:predicted TIM-barrel fold metal-dependent hydrolase
VPIIDFHTHIFPPEIIARRGVYLQRDDWFRQLYADSKARMVSADELIDSMDASGVDVSVAFGFAWADQGLCREANDYMLESVSRWPDRLCGFAQVNPVAKGAMAELERCMHKGLCGLGELMPDGQGYALDDRCLDDIMQQMAHWKRPVLIHGSEPVGHDYPGKSKSTLQPFYQLALRHPKVTFVAAHWGGGLCFYELMPEVQEALRNVYYDTAASLCLYRDDIFALAAQVILQKVLFATDYPLIDQGQFLRHIRRSGLSADALQSILGGNAARLLQMQGTA